MIGENVSVLYKIYIQFFSFLCLLLLLLVAFVVVAFLDKGGGGWTSFCKLYISVVLLLIFQSKAILTRIEKQVGNYSE